MIIVYLNETLDAMLTADRDSFLAYSWPMVDNYYRTAAWQLGKVLRVARLDGTVIAECQPYGASVILL